MRKFNVKVNGVAYNVEVEEVEALASKEESTIGTPIVETNLEKAEIHNETSSKNSPKVRTLPLIDDTDLVPVAVANESEIEAPVAEEEFINNYKSVYSGGSPVNLPEQPMDNMETSVTTPTMEPPTEVNMDNTIAMAPVHSWSAPAAEPVEQGFAFNAPKFPETPRKIGKNSVLAPLTGKIIVLPITEGSKVRCGDVLCVLDSDGVESEIMSPIDAEIVGIFVNNGSNVNMNDILFTLT